MIFHQTNNSVGKVNNFIETDRIKGRITLSNGKHEVPIHTNQRPKSVYMTVISNVDVDLVGHALSDTGFVLYADIKSPSAEVLYEYTVR